MTVGRPGREPDQRQPPDGWRGSIPEVVVTCVLVLVTCAFVYAYAGTGAAAIALVVWAVVILAIFRAALPITPPPLTAQHDTWQRVGRTGIMGFWRKRGIVTDATADMVAYDLDLRATLQHLLAARLAERHGISLYGDPDAARRLLLPTAREQELWFWLDPQRPAETRHGKGGIPPRTLAAILDRLERL
jgi:hypothetical protein